MRMLGRPIQTLLILFFIHFIVLSRFGFESSIFVAITLSFFFIFFNYRIIGFYNALLLVVPYLMLYDCETFVFTSFNIRLWYPIIVLSFLYDLFQVFVKREIFDYRFIGKFSLLYVFFIFIITLYHFYNDSFIFKIHNIKYWFFTVYTTFIFIKFFVVNQAKINLIIDFFCVLILFVALWGFLQFAMNLNGINNYQLDYFNLRPAAFFSETTWFSEYLVFGLILFYYQSVKSGKEIGKIVIVPVLLGLILSSSRNPYIGLVLFFILNLLIPSSGARPNIGKKLLINLIFISVLGCFFIIYKDFLIIYIDKVLDKFSEGDGSSYGRVIAFKKSIELILQKPFFGNGFAWSENDSSAIGGSAYGAKSFNIFLMLAHILGITGFVIILLLISNYYLSSFKLFLLNRTEEIKYSIILITYYLVISQFAPLHQYPIGIIILSLGIAFKYIKQPKIIS